MNHAFCREGLREVMGAIGPLTTPTQRKAAWTHITQIGHPVGEFHGPDGYCWHGQVCCAWDARAKGWMAWLDDRGISSTDTIRIAGRC